MHNFWPYSLTSFPWIWRQVTLQSPVEQHLYLQFLFFMFLHLFIQVLPFSVWPVCLGQSVLTFILESAMCVCVCVLLQIMSALLLALTLFSHGKFHDDEEVTHAHISQYLINLSTYISIHPSIHCAVMVLFFFPAGRQHAPGHTCHVYFFYRNASLRQHWPVRCLQREEVGANSGG